MAHVNFNYPEFRSEDGMRVTGTFTDPDPASIIGQVVIRFLVTQRVGEGSAERRAVVGGMGIWDGDETWEGFVSQAEMDTAGFPSTSGKVRGIGIALVIRNVPEGSPPAFETYTWCVTREPGGGGQVAA